MRRRARGAHVLLALGFLLGTAGYAHVAGHWVPQLRAHTDQVRQYTADLPHLLASNTTTRSASWSSTTEVVAAVTSLAEHAGVPVQQVHSIPLDAQELHVEVTVAGSTADVLRLADHLTPIGHVTKIAAGTTDGTTTPSGVVTLTATIDGERR